VRVVSRTRKDVSDHLDAGCTVNDLVTVATPEPAPTTVDGRPTASQRFVVTDTGGRQSKSMPQNRFPVTLHYIDVYEFPIDRKRPSGQGELSAGINR
jgi:hypothetical protein